MKTNTNIIEDVIVDLIWFFTPKSKRNKNG